MNGQQINKKTDRDRRIDRQMNVCTDRWNERERERERERETSRHGWKEDRWTKRHGDGPT